MGCIQPTWIRQRHEFGEGTVASGAAPCVLLGSDSGTAPALLWLFGERGFDWMLIVFPNYPDEKHLSPIHRCHSRAGKKTIQRGGGHRGVRIYRSAVVKFDVPAH